MDTPMLVLKLTPEFGGHRLEVVEEVVEYLVVNASADDAATRLSGVLALGRDENVLRDLDALTLLALASKLIFCTISPNKRPLMYH